MAKSAGFFSSKYLCEWCENEFDSKSKAQSHELDCEVSPSNLQKMEREWEEERVEKVNASRLKKIEQLQHSEDCRWNGDRCTCGIWDMLDTNAVEPLIKRLAETKDIETRQNIIGALGNIGDTRAVEPLIKLLEEEKNSDFSQADSREITWHAATALGLIGDERAYEPMIQALGHSQEAESIAYWLKDKGIQSSDYAGNPLVTRSKLTVNTDALARALGDSVEGVRNYCTEILDELNWKPETEKQQIDYLIATINKQEAVKELIRIGKPAVPSLIRALESTTWDSGYSGLHRLPSKSVIFEAAHSLGKIGDERAVEPLIKALGNQDLSFEYYSYVRDSITQALGELGDARAVKPLIEIFVKLPSPSEKSNRDKKNAYTAVANALKELSGTEAEFDRLELYNKAEEWYTFHGRLEEAARVRKLKAEQGAVKVDQTVVQGDYVDDRDTIVKDSVISKSNIGPGGKSKSEELREAKALLDDGIIDDDEFKQMKKEILGSELH